MFSLSRTELGAVDGNMGRKPPHAKASWEEYKSKLKFGKKYQQTGEITTFCNII